MLETETKPLYIWADGGVADLSVVKAAKARIGATWKVRPIVVQAPADRAALGDEDGARVPAGRILAFGTRPPWLCDYALVTERTSEERMEEALLWAVGELEEHPRATTLIDVLRAHLGAGVTELDPGLLESERRARVYFTGGDE